VADVMDNDKTKIKLCGLKNAKEVELACELGVWAVGFVLTKSPRQVNVGEALRLSGIASGYGVKSVGVFMDERPEEIIKTIKTAKLDIAQTHAKKVGYPWEKFEAEGIEYLRGFHVSSDDGLSVLEQVRGKSFLLDSTTPGSGKTSDWKLAKQAKEYGNVILAGGLSVDNVAEAIGVVSPWAVDVSSGIEFERGKKDLGLMRQFVQAVQAVGA
jgi:phosphoribosylanthranilate isomerase